MSSGQSIVIAQEAHLKRWGEMRAALWDWETAEDHAEDAREFYLSGHPERIAFMAVAASGDLIGFAEATLRTDYVEGCDTSPVTFLEGIFVEPDARISGVAAALTAAVAEWGKDRGCTEFASNALIDNIDSHRFHAAIGFEETDRLVYFRKRLDG